MLSKVLRVLDFDESVARQTRLLKQNHSVVIDLKNIGPECRTWMSSRMGERIKSVLNPELKNAVTFLGSGDFHHVSSLLIEQFEEPINVILVDHHPDWDILPPRLGYGSWVTTALRRENIVKFILLGISSSDISTFSIQTGNLNALKNNRLEIYPLSHPPTKVFLRRVPENVSLRIEKKFLGTKIHWREIRGQNISDFLGGIISRLETKNTYLSIDKDCLKRAYALTNWEEGCLELNELLELVRLIKENLNIIGLDIIGEYSRPKTQGIIKQFYTQLDHPKDFSAAQADEDEITQINEDTNLKLLKALWE